MNFKRLKNFVLERKAVGGGFSFCYPLPASTPETFYALYILKSVGEEIPDFDEHRRFVVSKLKEAKSISSIYLLLKCHEILEIDIDNRGNLEKYLMKKLDSINPGNGELSYELGTTATYSFESPDFLENLTGIMESLVILNGKPNKRLENFVQDNFDVILNKVRDLKSAFFAVCLLGKRVKEEISEFILQNQLPEGGFSKTPGSFPPYLEDTFYALSSLQKLGIEPEVEKNYEFVRKLQCSNGGFRRSLYGGISTLEDSYYAIASLEILGRI